MTLEGKVNEAIGRGDWSLAVSTAERLEEDAAWNGAACATWAQQLALYLILDQPNAARFLWRRVPADVRKKDSDLTQFWAVGQALWLRDYVVAFKTLDKKWSVSLRPLADALRAAVRARNIELVGRAYSVISDKELASMIGGSKNDAIAAAGVQGWPVDKKAGLISPAPVVTAQPEQSMAVKQLENLSNYVLNLES